MRDPNRIPRMLEKLGKLWERYPDQRLYQLLNNIMSNGALPYSFFYVEDAETEKLLDRCLEKGSLVL